MDFGALNRRTLVWLWWVVGLVALVLVIWGVSLHYHATPSQNALRRAVEGGSDTAGLPSSGR
jgi:hypothetical protein